MVLLWKAPVYQGRDPVNGFYVDMKEADAPHEAWRGINSKATEKIFMKVLHYSFLLRVFYSFKIPKKQQHYSELVH